MAAGSSTYVTSPDGVTWTSRTFPISTTNRIAFGAGLFVMIGNSSTNTCYSSPDGIIWTAQTLSATAVWNAIAFGTSSSYFVVTSSASTTYSYSTTGTSWTSSTLPSSGWTNLFADNTNFIATKSSTSFLVCPAAHISGGGSYWATITSTIDPSSMASNGSITLLSNSNSNSTAYITSTNDSTWTAQTFPTTALWSITYYDGLFMAVGSAVSNSSYTSPDGINWSSSIPLAVSTVYWVPPVGANGQFVTLEESSAVAGLYAIPPPTITLVAKKPTIAIIGNFIQIGLITLTTKKATLNIAAYTPVWTIGTLPSAGNNGWTSTVYGNNTYVAISELGSVATSTDGITWTNTSITGSNLWKCITFGAGLFVILSDVSSSTVCITSPNGNAWTTQTFPSGSYFENLAYGNGTFVALGSNIAARSPDGINWSTTAYPVYTPYNAMSFINGLFLNYQYSSPDGITWTAFSPGAGTPATNQPIAYGNGIYVLISGDTSYVSSNLTSWSSSTMPILSTYGPISFYGGQFITVNFAGTSAFGLSSSDGVTWTSLPLTSQPWRAIQRGPDRFVALSDTGYSAVLLDQPEIVISAKKPTLHIIANVDNFLGVFAKKPTLSVVGYYTSNIGILQLTAKKPIIAFVGNGNTFCMIQLTAKKSTISFAGNFLYFGAIVVAAKKSILAITSELIYSANINTDAKKTSIAINGNVNETGIITLRPAKTTVAIQGNNGFNGVVSLQSKKAYCLVLGAYIAPVVGLVALQAKKATCALATFSIAPISGNIAVLAKKSTVHMAGSFNVGVISTGAKKANLFVSANVSQIGNFTLYANKPTIQIAGNQGYFSAAIQTYAQKTTIALNAVFDNIPIYYAKSPFVIPPYVPSYTSKDFLNGFLRLLPTGRMWPKEPTSNMSLALEPQLGTYARSTVEGIAPSPINTGGGLASITGSSNRAGDLLRDTIPFFNVLGANTIVELLPEWQTTLGLPDPCLPTDATVEQQVSQVVARFISVGGQSIQYYTDYAGYLGYQINITEYDTFRPGYSIAGAPVGGENYAYSWQVTSADTGEWRFEAGVNTAGEPLGSFGNDVLICELNRVAPAHTVINYNILQYGAMALTPIRPTMAIIASLATGLTTPLIWSSHSLPVSASWGDLAFGNSQFVGIANSSNIGITSPDGITWTQFTMPVSDQWYSMCYNGSIFVVLSLTDCAVSPDGNTWTMHSLPVVAQWQAGIVWGNGIFCALANQDLVITSPDAISWTAHTLPSGAWSGKIAFGNGVFVIKNSGTSSTRNNYISSDGITWTLTGTEAASAVMMTFGAGVFVILYPSSYGVSSDGITWTPGALPSSVSPSYWHNIVYGGGLFIASAYDSTSAISSPDGVTWSVSTLPALTDWQVIAYGAGVVATLNQTSATVAIAT